MGNLSTEPWFQSLKWLPTALDYLCLGMVCWILFFPASWLVSISSWYTDFVEKYIQSPDSPTAPDIITKYNGQVPVVLLHQLPVLIWCLCIPLQLNGSANIFNRHLAKLNHRYRGYLAAICAVTSAVGVLLMEYLGLSVHPHRPSNVYKLRAELVYFISTIVVAITYARKRNTGKHQAWILRHTASGLSVAVQRIVIAFGALLGATGLVDWQSNDDLRRDGFDACGVIAWCICASVCEYAIRSNRHLTLFQGPLKQKAS